MSEGCHRESIYSGICSGKDDSVGSPQPDSIIGNDYATPDGTCIRDYIHVNDLASAHVGALQLLLNEGESDVFNLGTGTGFSVLEVLAAAEKVSSLPVPRAILPRRAGDPPILI